ncbi:MAG: response regulator transcription factor [Lachnospiraceae bacterium]|jgi:two-component system vancomycin resistance associated response regulator VraR|nr:response regulator transcription factor [Lachnospiraceae bacterium]
MSYKVVIAEDFRMIREIFESTVERAEGYTLAASFPTAIQALRYVEKNDADLVIMDVLIPGSMSGLGAAEKIKAIKPDVKIIVVTSMPELSYERKAREIGVEGFWQKEVQEQPIQEIMDRVMAGETVYPSEQVEVPIGNAMSTEFTKREADVLKELVTGASNKEIAGKLNMGESTVKMHITNMLQKSGYHSRLELALMARHYGIAINEKNHPVTES